MTIHQLSRVEARRIAVTAQLLDAQGPTDLLEVVRHLTMLQHDQMRWVESNDACRLELLEVVHDR